MSENVNEETTGSTVEETPDPIPSEQPDPDHSGDGDGDGDGDTTDAPDEGDTPAAPDETEQQTDPQDAAPTEKEIEKAHKALGKLREHVARRVGDILGESAIDAIPCPCCDGLMPGFVWSQPVGDDAEEIMQRVAHWLGFATKGDLEPHPDAVLCDTCKGKGQVSTPSQVPGYDVVTCPQCSGTGRTLKPTLVTPQPVDPAAPAAPITTGPTVTDPGLSPAALAAQQEGYVVFKAPTLDQPAVPAAQ